MSRRTACSGQHANCRACKTRNDWPAIRAEAYASSRALGWLLWLVVVCALLAGAVAWAVLG